MAVVNAAQASVKTVADPNASYESLKSLWNKSRAVCSGERFVKEFDGVVDTIGFSNLLIPFSPSMTQKQYSFYKAEAELPGITAQFSKMIVGGLLRKKPALELPESVPAEAFNWIMNEFAKDDSSLSSFLDEALWEEIQTSRAWVFVDYPSIQNPEALTAEEKALYKPYPILHKAEAIINWRTSEDQFGKSILNRVIVRGYKEEFERNEFHPTFKDTVWVHELDDSGYYRIRMYQRVDETTQLPVIAGQQILRPTDNKPKFELIEVIENILSNGERLRMIPAWPLNGSIEALEPSLSPIIDKEISLYNKLSRRNHLLYGASTYTPVIISDMSDEDFDNIVNSGLGTWIRLRQGDDAKVLETPTAALQDMDRAIGAAIEEMAKLGIRMLSPESAQSGVALEIRNAAQTAQLGTLNNKVSATMSQIICFMLNWRYNLQLRTSEIKFSMSADFNPIPLGADWLRLATEWYQQGLIPRSIWLMILKQNDIVPPDYDDDQGQQEITENLDVIMQRQNDQYANQVQLQQQLAAQQETN
jgi:hypothetical protein